MSQKKTAPSRKSAPSLSDVAREEVAKILGPARGDAFDSDFVWRVFKNGFGDRPAPLVTLTHAAKASRLAGNETADDNTPDDSQRAAFALGFAIGARLGGGR